MPGLFDQLELVEKQLESKTHAATEDRSQPTGTVPMADNTWVKHRTSHNQSQYHVAGQGNVWSNYAINSYMDRRGMTHGWYEGAALPTAQSLPGPISFAQNNALNNSVPGLTWDPAEGILISDMGNLPGLVTATVDRSGGELTQNVEWGGTMGLHCVPVIGDVACQCANPEIRYHTGLERQQLDPAWYPQSQHGRRYHGGNDAGVQTHIVNCTAGQDGGRHFEYQLQPVGSSGVAYGLGQGHPASAWTAPYWEHVYLV